MLKKIKYIFLILLIVFVLLEKIVLGAELGNANLDANYNTENILNETDIIIEDDANLLSLDQKIELKRQMVPLSEYGIVLFKTTKTEGSYSPLKYIQNYYYSKFGNKKGVAFYIDMKNRQICACATGGLDEIITNGKCDIIMDNVYKYAKTGDYLECAKQTFIQMNKLLSGKKIAEKMKYICNAFLSIMISLFVSLRNIF